MIANKINNWLDYNSEQHTKIAELSILIMIAAVFLASQPEQLPVYNVFAGFMFILLTHVVFGLWVDEVQSRDPIRPPNRVESVLDITTLAGITVTMSICVFTLI